MSSRIAGGFEISIGDLESGRWFLNGQSCKGERSMVVLRVFDPPMCCSTGICGPEVNPAQQNSAKILIMNYSLTAGENDESAETVPH